MTKKEFAVISHNILTGGQERLPLITRNARNQSADFFAIQEANGFIDNEQKLLKNISSELSLPYVAISPAKEGDFNVASLSRVPIRERRELKGFRNAGLAVSIESSVGAITICNIHLTPFTEEQRLKELDTVMQAASPDDQTLVIGDLNSLSPEDGYRPDIIELFNPQQHKKFVSDGQLQYNVVSSLLSAGFVDLAVYSGKNSMNTVPTEYNQDAAHATPLRLDYMFASPALARKLVEFQVIKNDLTNAASDHYPIRAVFR